MKLIFSILGLLASFNGAAQSTWRLASPTFANASHPNLRINAIERTTEATIFEMSYTTAVQDSTYLEICNTFHLVSQGRKIAVLLHAEGAPIADMTSQTVFECEPKPIGRFVPSETEAHFKLYFGALPPTVQQVDLIEFNGRESCEFHIQGIQLPASEGTNPAILLDSTQVAEKPVTPAGENRRVVVGNETKVHQQFVDIEIWDNDREDGDVLSLSLNDNWVLKGYELAKAKKYLRLQLQKGENWLMMRADNLGSIPPNTAAIAVLEGGTRKVFMLHSDTSKSEILKLVWDGQARF